jgi:hypothetical protein
VVAEDDPLVRGNEVTAVLQPLGGGGAHGIESENLGSDEFAIETVTQGKDAKCRNHQPHGIDLLAAMQGDRAHGKCACDGDGDPEKDSREFLHVEGCIVANVRGSWQVVWAEPSCPRVAMPWGLPKARLPRCATANETQGPLRVRSGRALDSALRFVRDDTLRARGIKTRF